MTSRVVPAVAEVIAASRRAKAFNRLDFPALGGPRIAIESPSRSRSPRRLSARCAAISRHPDLHYGCENLTGNTLWEPFVREIDRSLLIRKGMEQPLPPAPS